LPLSRLCPRADGTYARSRLPAHVLDGGLVDLRLAEPARSADAVLGFFWGRTTDIAGDFLARRAARMTMGVFDARLLIIKNFRRGLFGGRVFLAGPEERSLSLSLFPIPDLIICVRWRVVVAMVVVVVRLRVGRISLRFAKLLLIGGLFSGME